MLLTRSKDLTLTYSNIETTEKSGSAKWEAVYTFSKTGKKIINSIQAEFEFKEGKIIKHTDSFNLNKWFLNAFGWKGYLFIAIPFFQFKFKKKVRQTLESFIAHQSK